MTFEIECEKNASKELPQIPVLRILIMGVLTLGMYVVYWAYKHWKVLKSDRAEACAIFSYITVYWLFYYQSKIVKRINPVLAGFLFFITFLFMRVTHIPAIVLVMIFVQQEINKYYLKENGSNNYIPAKGGIIFSICAYLICILFYFAYEYAKH